jgi:predicted RNA methylase
MTLSSPPSSVLATSLHSDPMVSATPSTSTAAAIIAAATLLLPTIEKGQSIDARTLRTAMETAFGGSDADGHWDWKTAYDACEVTQILFLRKFGAGLTKRFDTPAALLEVVGKISLLFPTHTRRSESSQSLQQFSTPVGLGLVAAVAAAITSTDVVLEPSAGSGLLAIHAELAGAALVLNEYADTRVDLLERLFAETPVTRFDAAHINDYLDVAIRPSVVLMNPPFSAVAHVDGSVKDAAMRHISSALSRLCYGGRLVVITGAGCSPDVPAWRDAFTQLQERGRVLFTAAIDGKVYAKHGTTIATRLTVIDRIPADDPNVFPISPGIAPDTATLLAWVLEHVPPRAVVSGQTMGAAPLAAIRSAPIKVARAGIIPSPTPVHVAAHIEAVELSYEVKDWTPELGAQLTDAIYEPYVLQSLTIDGATPHPTALVQSAAMSSVAPPKPSYLPHLPASVVGDAMLSDAQLESVIYAGEAHSGFLSGAWNVDATYDKIDAAPDEAEHAVQFRRGWFLGDGTGAGKGRQVAGISLGSYGRPRITMELKEEGLDVGERRVGRLMRINGIRPVRTRKHKITTNSNHRLGIAANWLDGDFVADAPNQKWAGDIT